ncbi:reverse transcriptase domain-containing protein [Tanacetum coccineum]
MIRVVRINVPLIDVLAGMPNYGKFLKELISNKHKIEQISAAFLSDESSAMIQNKVPPKLEDPGSFLIPCNFDKTFSCNALADLGASINLMPYSLYAKLSLETLKPTKISVRLADKSFQYPVGIAKNMLVEVGKFTFPVDLVILEMEEDSKVPIILGRPFLHTADAVIRVKQRQLNFGVGTERIIFNIDSAMKHSYSNDDTCFRIDVIDEILEEDFCALLDEGSKILHSIKGTLLEEEIFAEFDEFIAMTIKTSLEEPPTDLELKPLPDNLEYVFLEEPSFLPVIISSQLSKEKKSKLISVLKKHKQAFDWKMKDILGICPSFCKHKIQLLDDKKPVVQKQRRLNLNMQEVVKKEIVKLLDTGIIYPIADSPWVSPIHCVPKKGGITVVTNENDELVPTRTVTGCRVNKARNKDTLVDIILESHYLVMSDSEHSTVSHTSISSDSGLSSWGIPLMDVGELLEMNPYEEVAQQGQAAPPSPVYVLEPMYPEYLVPFDDDIPVEDQSYTVDASPTTLSLDYVTDSDLEEDPEKEPEADLEEDPIDYDADAEDHEDEEEESSEDDETKSFETDESAATPPPPSAYRTTSRISVQSHAPIPFPSEAEVARILALPTPPPSPLTPLSSPLP